MERSVKDIWHSLNITFGVIAGLEVVSFIGLVVFGMLTGIKQNSFWEGFGYASLITQLAFMPFTLNVWKSYATGYIVNMGNRTFSFPASDVENSILEIITLRPLFNLARRSTVSLDEIRSLNNETKRWTTKHKVNGKTQTKQHVSWLLNMSGDFGSQQFEFNSKQKRDECRSLITSSVKIKGSSDMNLDL